MIALESYAAPYSTFRRKSLTDNLPVARDPWMQVEGESNADYAAFEQYCRLGHGRSLRQLAARLGISYDRVKTMSKKTDWESRSDLYDKACQSLTPTELSLEDTLAFQYAVGSAMLKLGIAALELKNPNLIKTSDVIRLLKEGSEIQGKAAGISNTVTLKVESDSVAKINSLLDELGMIEGEAVEEDDG